MAEPHLVDNETRQSTHLMPARAAVWVADGKAYDDVDYAIGVETALGAMGIDALRRSLLDSGTDTPEVDLHVLTGGETSAYADVAWMRAAIERVQDLIEGAEQNRHAVFGICLGAHMIAHAISPGSVGRAERIEVGLEPVVFGDGNVIPVSQFHFEQIRRRPLIEAGGRILGRNDHSPVQAFQFGMRVIGVQFHPELDPDDMRKVITTHQDTIRQHGGSVDDALASIRDRQEVWSPALFERLIHRVL